MVIEVAIGPGGAARMFRVEVVASPAGEATATVELDAEALMARRGLLQQAVLASAVLPSRRVPCPVIARSDGRTSKGDDHGGTGRGRGEAAAARRRLRAIHKPMVHEVCLSCHSRRAGPDPGVIPR